jgi:hypothetical protein
LPAPEAAEVHADQSQLTPPEPPRAAKPKRRPEKSRSEKPTDAAAPEEKPEIAQAEPELLAKPEAQPAESAPPAPKPHEKPKPPQPPRPKKSRSDDQMDLFAEPVNPAHLRKAVNEILPLLVDSDPGAKDCFKANRTVFRPAFAAEGFAEFEGSIKGADFAAALEHLKKACKRHGVTV